VEYNHAFGEHVQVAVERLQPLDHHICELYDISLLYQPHTKGPAHLLLALLDVQTHRELHKVLVYEPCIEGDNMVG
jgi:hypothetical protein